MKLLHFFVSVAAFAVMWLLYCQNNSIGIANRYHIFVCGIFAFCLFFFIRTYNAYSVEYSSIGDVSFSLGLSSFLSTSAVYVMTLVAWNKFYSPVYFLAFLLFSLAFSTLWAFTSNRIYYKITKPLKTCFVYRNKKDLRKLEEVRRHYKKFDIAEEFEATGDYREILEKVSGYEAVFVAGVDASLRNSIAKFCMEKGIQGYFAPHVGDIIMSGAEHVKSFSNPIMNIRNNNVWPEFLVLKRIFDILISLFGIIVLSPLMIIAALAIRLSDGGPAIYKQVRLTKGRKEFTIYKFRSMRIDAESDGVARLATENDDRITPIGKILRATRMDELPQLFNILAGDMSLVGPRPERPEIAEQYEKALPAFKLRLGVKAGLTGYAQVFGKYCTDPYDKLELDLMYINNMSIITDIQIMFATLRIIFIKESTSGILENQITALQEEENL